MGKFKRMSLVLLIVGVLAVAAGCSCSTDAEVATETTSGSTTSDRTTNDRTTNERVTTNTNNTTNGNGNNTINGTTDNGTTGRGIIDDLGNILDDGNTETTSTNNGVRNGLR